MKKIDKELEALLVELKLKDSGYRFYVVDNHQDIASIEVFDDKTFVYLRVKDKNLLLKLQALKVGGIVFPPLTKEKLLSLFQNQNKALDIDYDIIKSKIIAKAESLPALPTVIQKLISLTSNDKSTFKEIIDELKKDQGLVGKVLKIVNSPFYGIRKEITSVERSAVLLGMSTIKNIALAAFSFDLFNKNFAVYETDSKNMWLHSFLVARISEELENLCGFEDKGGLFLAGLMHDLGKVVLVDFLTNKVSSIDEEKRLLGIDHAEVSAVILQKWNVNDKIIEAVEKHHLESDDIFYRCLYFANILANSEDLEKDVKDVSMKLGLNFADLYPRVEMIIKSDYEEFI
ncbi:HDOD domain-containing protein [Deferribacter thermophilus]|uniref:HDOD domain-containing protein n=1 Tax=Deferribacter thermophilus TaxID=53573 RepID=UPI003C154E41